MKLAAFLTIKDYLYPRYEETYPQYSYATEPEPVETTVNYNSDTEFFQLANGMEYDKGMENHSGVDGDFASHKSAAICWRYKKAKGITKKRAAPVKGAVLFCNNKSKNVYNIFIILVK